MDDLNRLFESIDEEYNKRNTDWQLFYVYKLEEQSVRVEFKQRENSPIKELNLTGYYFFAIRKWNDEPVVCVGFYFPEDINDDLSDTIVQSGFFKLPMNGIYSSLVKQAELRSQPFHKALLDEHLQVVKLDKDRLSYYSITNSEPVIYSPPQEWKNLSDVRNPKYQDLIEDPSDYKFLTDSCNELFEKTVKKWTD